MAINLNESFRIDTYIRAIDLIKIANQIYNDNMACVRLSITSCQNEDHDGEVKFSAIPTLTSEDDIKYYPVIKPLHTIEFND